MSDPSEIASDLREEVGSVLVGNEDIIDNLLIALLTRGHVLLEGVPGVAKTTIANLFAGATGLQYRRIQMTPDVVPADITGTHVYRERTGEFELQRGPVFANVVVADEINRATPKTQSALLEAMQERHVTIEGETLALPMPFIVVATQNPIEHEGTWELPEAQRDRFQFKLTVGLPTRSVEREIIDRFDADPWLSPESVEQVIDPEALTAAQDVVAEIHVEDVVKEYVLDIVNATRQHGDVRHGVSPRATLALLNAAKARAALQDREYVIPDDVKGLVPMVLGHRLVLTTDATLSDIDSEDVIRDVLGSVNPPGSEMSEEATVIQDGGNPDDT